jgi:hypothetical protein
MNVINIHDFGVTVMGADVSDWHKEIGRNIFLVRVVFESGKNQPYFDKDRQMFVLPILLHCKKYRIHLLETSEAIVEIGHRLYLCTRKSRKPTVQEYTNTREAEAVLLVA